jgi:hypothetical protein
LGSSLPFERIDEPRYGQQVGTASRVQAPCCEVATNRRALIPHPIAAKTAPSTSATVAPSGETETECRKRTKCWPIRANELVVGRAARRLPTLPRFGGKRTSLTGRTGRTGPTRGANSGVYAIAHRRPDATASQGQRFSRFSRGTIRLSTLASVISPRTRSISGLVKEHIYLRVDHSASEVGP